MATRAANGPPSAQPATASAPAVCTSVPQQTASPSWVGEFVVGHADGLQRLRPECRASSGTRSPPPASRAPVPAGSSGSCCRRGAGRSCIAPQCGRWVGPTLNLTQGAAVTRRGARLSTAASAGLRQVLGSGERADLGVPIAAEQFPSVRPRVHVQAFRSTQRRGRRRRDPGDGGSEIPSSGRTPSSTCRARIWPPCLAALGGAPGPWPA
jgi:hypothetical protein